VADLSSFRVVATISDVHASRVAAGMPARVKIDDATTVSGTIASVDPRIENGAVRFWVDLDAASHPKLRNNLRVYVYAVTGARTNVLQLRRAHWEMQTTTASSSSAAIPPSAPRCASGCGAKRTWRWWMACGKAMK